MKIFLTRQRLLNAIINIVYSKYIHIYYIYEKERGERFVKALSVNAVIQPIKFLGRTFQGQGFT